MPGLEVFCEFLKSGLHQYFSELRMKRKMKWEIKSSFFSIFLYFSQKSIIFHEMSFIFPIQHEKSIFFFWRGGNIQYSPSVFKSKIVSQDTLYEDSEYSIITELYCSLISLKSGAQLLCKLYLFLRFVFRTWMARENLVVVG